MATPVNSWDQAGTWMGAPGSWLILTPPPPASGSVRGMDASDQVGEIEGHAVLWRGTPESRVDLEGVDQGSVALAARSGVQVGTVVAPSALNRAVLWTGAFGSRINLHPSGAYDSIAYATDGLRQGGTVRWVWNGAEHAALWSGTAASVVDLSPAGRPSAVRGMAPGVQVGESFFQGQGYRASLWRGTAASWTDLHPPGNPGGSRLLATAGNVHVGTLSEAGLERAAVNFGTPTTWVSLHRFLPPQYQSWSVATSVHQEGPTISIGGYAYGSTAQREAILWIGTVPCYANCDASTAFPILNVADFTCFLHRFATGDAYANCDGSTAPPTLNVADFVCFLQRFAVGCQ
jgi:hypothetical protein